MLTACCAPVAEDVSLALICPALLVITAIALLGCAAKTFEELGLSQELLQVRASIVLLFACVHLCTQFAACRAAVMFV